MDFNPIFLGLGVVALIAIKAAILALFFRVVVSTNDMDIVQSAKATISYGKDQPAGNVYYAWPAWLPIVGVRVIRLPVSVFSQNLSDYAAYDKGRVPFMIDIIGFFRIADSNVAAQRVSTMAQLVQQLEFILKGAIRTILASSEIEEILEGRSKFGEMFTREVDEQLKQWGVQTVKGIELVDIRDAADSKVISNIMAKKKSLIEMQSRVEVAGNMQTAQMAEVDAARAVEIRKQEAQEQVGVRSAQREQTIGISNQQAAQAIKEEERATATKTMAVIEVERVRQAEIDRSALVVKADQARQTAIIDADAQKQQTVLIADGNLESAKRHAEGVEIEGRAKGEAEKAVLLAPVQAQITLAKEIGENPGYQTYLVTIRQIEAGQVVGIEQAKALQNAEVKVIANTGSGPVDGIESVMGLLTPKGGTQLGAMLEAFKNTDVGAALLDRVEGRANGHAKPAA